eukprot:CAMPEP_0119478222 /NCGR_PEP_ID=MMETSP1344-20130328/8061_1 /TAXON_ID=236787 /ORGANISM="Florenciella parvula, Strain CCMP2471" /LENGTH=80 /DNA_ID=CAMNT_0007512377 /DNA_START=86 /DNA_END=324 /DNA_ORIENTATION=+
MAAVEEKPTRAASHQGNAVLVHKHVFGLKGDVKGHLHYVDEAQVVYPCGHNTVVYNTETREQMLIHGMHSLSGGAAAAAA